MTISEIKLKTLNNKPPTFKKIIYPLPNNPDIQKPYFVCIACGMRGSGKSFCVVKCIQNQETSGFYDPITGNNVPIRTILFSPTVAGNPIFSALKSLKEEDIINDFDNTILLEVLEQIKYDREQTKIYKEYVEAYKKYEKLTPQQFLKWKDEKAIALLYSKDFIHYEELEKPPHPDGIVTNIILDDCLASNAFSTKKGNHLLKAVLNGRHYGVNVFICAQNLKSVNKAIRLNTELFMLFRCCSQKVILNDLYELISALCTEDEFLELYNEATKDNFYDCLVIDKKADKDKIFKKNLDVVLTLNKNKI
jgi:hypothetical protein